MMAGEVNLGVMGTWPISVVAVVFGEARDVLRAASQAFLCDHCLYVFPLEAAKAGAIHFVNGQGREATVAGQAGLTLYCARCYDTKRQEAALLAFSKLFGDLDDSPLTLGSIDLSALLGGPGIKPVEDPREMPGQYL